MPRRKPAKRKTTTHQSKSRQTKPRSQHTYENQSDFEKFRYGRNWFNRQWKALQYRSTGEICCVCMEAKCDLLHHGWYRRDDGSTVKDTEVSGVDLFTVCENCHENVCHSPFNWVKPTGTTLKERALSPHNTPEFHALLKRNWKTLNDRITGRSLSTPQPIPMSRPTIVPSKPQWTPTPKRSPFHKRSDRTSLSDIPVSAWLLFGAAVVAIVLLVLL